MSLHFRTSKFVAVVAGILSIGAFAPASAYTNAPVSTDGTDGRVSDILADPNSKFVYVAGSFTQVNTPSGAAAVPYVARFDPTTGRFDETWHPDPNGPVLALALSPDGGTLYLGGDFSEVSGQAHRKLAAVVTSAGSAVKTWKPKVDGPVKALATAGDFLYVGGKFDNATPPGGTALARPNLARLDASTGAVDGWAPRADAQVLSIVPAGDHVFVGGEFTSINGTEAKYSKSIASLSTGTGSVLPIVWANTNQKAKPMAFDLYLDGDHLLAGVGGSGGACASLDATTGTLEWSKHTNGNVQAVTAIAGVAYCGGHFGGLNSFAGQTRHKLAAVDQSTTLVTDFAPRVNSPLGVWALDATGSSLYVGGDFTRIGGRDQPHFAMYQ